MSGGSPPTKTFLEYRSTWSGSSDVGEQFNDHIDGTIWSVEGRNIVCLRWCFPRTKTRSPKLDYCNLVIISRLAVPTTSLVLRVSWLICYRSKGHYQQIILRKKKQKEWYGMSKNLATEIVNTSFFHHYPSFKVSNFKKISWQVYILSNS